MIKYIFHLSDIHIRNGDEKYSRYYEYKNVFESLFISIKKNITKKNLSYNEALYHSIRINEFKKSKWKRNTGENKRPQI